MKHVLTLSIMILITFVAYGQTDLITKDTIHSESFDYVDDYICINGNKYTVALSDNGLLYMINQKDIDYEIGVITERTEELFVNVHTKSAIFASFWDVGAKVYKIKQVEAQYYIAVEWQDAYADNKYYVYCYKKNEKAKKTLQKFNEAMKEKH